DRGEHRVGVSSGGERGEIAGGVAFESGGDHVGGVRAELNVAPSATARVDGDVPKELAEPVRSADERIAVVRERQGHETATREPARDAAEEDRVVEVRAAPRIDERREAVGALQRLEPFRRVERG